MALQKVLGVDTLKGKTGDVPVSSLEGKTLLVYFSAHWCPPCRQFTPVLAKFYREQKAKRDDFELVFASSDKDQSQFDEYYKEHPWLALPFSERKAKDKLSRKFKVQGIPSLVVIDKDGNTITTNARNNVSQDPEGKKFPWVPRKVYEILAETKITSKDGTVITVDDLKKLDAVALYFSAHWCPPCRAFTPRLVSTYGKIKAAGKSKTEFIYVSSDREEKEFEDYYSEMPWARLPFQDARVKELKEVCEVEGIPTLITLKGDGTIINKDARGVASGDADGAQFPWAPVELEACTPFQPNDAVVDALNSDMCIVLHANGAANKETSKIEFTKAAEKFHAEVNKGTDTPVRFFVCDSEEGDDLYGRVLQALGASKGQLGVSTVLAFNLPNERAKTTLPAGDISEAAVFDFASAFKKAQDE